MICGLASCKSRGKIRRKFDFNCFKVFPPHPVTHHHELQIPQKWPQAIFPRALTLIHLPCPWWSYHSFSICLRCWFFSACHSQLYTSQWKSSITAERCLQANIMCSSVWCKHPLQPSSIILPSKEKALSSHFHFCQMRSLHIKTGRYEQAAFTLFCFVTALCAQTDKLAPIWQPCWVDYYLPHIRCILDISEPF